MPPRPPPRNSTPITPGAVTSPMVGTAYRAAEPTADPFVNVGDQVNEGQTVLIIEAMKTFNEIPAPRSGHGTSGPVRQPVAGGIRRRADDHRVAGALDPVADFEKVLIANRGEIALRIHRACREMGIETVAVHSTADEQAKYVRLADQSVCIGPPAAQQSYLHIPSLLAAAEISGADAIHPGYGFLSENAAFAEMVEEHGFVFIGPSPEHIRLMGDKIAAKETMTKLGVPVVPGSDGEITDLEQARQLGEKIGYPILIKAASGRRRSRHESGATAGRPRRRDRRGKDREQGRLQRRRGLYREIPGRAAPYRGADHRRRPRPCDPFGASAIAPCSAVIRRFLEEAPSPVLNTEARRRIGSIVANAMSAIKYRSLGTIEFLYEKGEFYFIEMNTRLQVEHPVTEMVTRIDLVREQIRIAEGKPMSFTQDTVFWRGHSIECRINAEDPVTFTPSPGKVVEFHQPGGLGVRVDSALYSGYVVPPHYDSLIAKLIVMGQTRDECMMRLKRCLEEMVVDGIATNIPLHLDLMNNDDFAKGDYNIHWLESYLANRQD